MEPNWAKIKNEYVSKGTPYRELAKKHGVILKTLARHAKNEEWVRLREEFVNRLSTESLHKTQAQAIATETVDLAPATNASQISFTLMRLMGRNSATMIVTRIVQNAPRMTVTPLKISI